MQDFSGKSEIDWSKSIHEIDLQLYRKYNLNNEEIQLIGSKIQSMNNINEKFLTDISFRKKKNNI